jgi:hypothetical protein
VAEDESSSEQPTKPAEDEQPTDDLDNLSIDQLKDMYKQVLGKIPKGRCANKRQWLIDQIKKNRPGHGASGGAAASSDAAPPRRRAGGKEPADRQPHEQMRSQAASGERPVTKPVATTKNQLSPAMMNLYKARQSAHEEGDPALAATIEAAIKATGGDPEAPSPAPVANKSPAASAKRPAQATTR